MYFKREYNVDLSNLINNKVPFYAHKKTGKQETLQEHTNLCAKYFKRIITSRNLESIFLNFEKLCLKDISEEGKELFRELLINTVLFHDIGKINPIFQKKNMENNIRGSEKFSQIGSKHSIISSVLYIDYYIKRVTNLPKSDVNEIILFLYLNAYVISKHHGDLDVFYKFLKLFDEDEDGYNVIEILKDNGKTVYNHDLNINRNMAKKICELVKISLVKNTEDSNGIYIYIYEKLIFSLLVAADFYSTTEFMNDVELEEFGDIRGIEEFYDIYKCTGIYKVIRQYEQKQYNEKKNLGNEKNINILRTEMFLDAEKELEKNIENNIFFLEAPTGSGKSNVSMNLSFKLLEQNNNLRKIYYVYPFNTLVEQNLQSLKKIFGYHKEIFNKISVINSISPIKLDEVKKKGKYEEDDYNYYAKALLNRQFLNYPMILTTHVSIFKTMFNASKESAFAFHQLANSVIVLDEIQSYKNIIWTEIITFLKAFAKLLNIKVIIMSATLPDLNLLIGSIEGTTNLILNRDKYFSNPLFRDRVKVDYELMNSSEVMEDLYEHVKKNSFLGKKVLIEFIKKDSAYSFFRRLKSDEDISCRIELMTGDDNSIERERILDEVKNDGGLILVATQVIEAGVDIDMDIGYKDISKLDSDEQFLGRINRSCTKTGIVHFFNLDDTKSIYSNDVRVNNSLSLIDESMKRVLLNKDFGEYYKKVLEAIIKIYNESFSDSNIKEFFNEAVEKFNFKKVEERMKLIDDNSWSMSVFLSSVIERSDGTIINGNEVWEEYRRLLQNSSMDYAENKVKLSEVRSKMNYFIYEIKKNDNFIYNERLGELYFIENGEDYFEDGKLNKEKFISGVGVFI
ncbi:CRISPR-associated helicase Cas3' [Clostridium manihotivorum]|uniref:CRISPR-associated helicase/endonuclease Cas3 n=1 Tax=Clostridium manihotivorum TaxID=2320868 RepID=A0A410DWP1_9CLOT|nr:CRISPR-associated helicase Cas3' [Clostridium manihotivorum]QAA33495.1 CRISPR-associated helicase/endonuclease Cas3 [Clostridium manihotivorum]